MNRNAKPLVLVVALIVFAAAVYFLPVREGLSLGLGWIESHRAIAWIVYIAAYIVASVLLFPGSIITLAAGFIFGLPIGVAIVSAGSVLGGTCSFVLGRQFMREWVKGKISRLPRFSALDRATRTDGFTIVLLARLSPLFPFNLLNYGLGITGVKLRDFFFASWIGMLPGTILYVYIGTLANDLTFIMSGEIESGPAGTVLLVAGLIATLALTAVITRKATQALNSELNSEANSDRDIDLNLHSPTGMGTAGLSAKTADTEKPK
jgi:uncharacterized membrane protein YdjX (TVP38/TMEM64 family)